MLNPTPTLRPPRRLSEDLAEVARPPRLQGLLAAGGVTAPIVDEGRR